MQRNKWLELLIFVLFANVFFFHAVGTVALWLVIFGLWALSIRLFDSGKKETRAVKWWGSAILVILMSLYLTINSAEKVVLLIMTSLMVILVAVYSWLKQGQIGGILELALSGTQVVRTYLQSGWMLLQSAIAGRLRQVLPLAQVKKEKSPWVRSIVVGLLIGLPLVAWLIMTLTKADPVFASYIKHILSEKLLSELPGRLVLSVLLFLLLIPLLLMQFKSYVSPLGWLVKAKWGREMTVVTGMVVFVLGVFLVVQWPYVFASVARETDLSKYGVATYSEYVQKGFWDLLKVVVMVFGVSWIGYLLNKNQTGQERKILMGMQGILGLEFVVFILSIFRRVWLYQSYHGFSLARLYGLALLTLIVGMTVTMALRYVYKNVRWVKIEAGWILLVIVTTIGINMEGLVVAHPPTVNNRVDYVYLSRLSSDGKEGWKQAYEWARQILDKNTARTGQFGGDDRRDIFYAGLITRNLTKNYHELVMQYGTDEEIKTYFREVIATKREIVHMSPIDGGASSLLGDLRQAESDLEKDNWLEKVDITPTPIIAPTWDYGFPNYKAHQDDQYFYTQESQEKERLSGIDLMLAYDPLRNQVYKWIRQEIGYDKLLEMQKQDFSLQKRIAAQPEDARDFDIDISLDSPFLR